MEELERELTAADAKSMHLKKIKAAIAAVTGNASETRAQSWTRPSRRRSRWPRRHRARRSSPRRRSAARLQKPFAAFLSHHKLACAGGGALPQIRARARARRRDLSRQRRPEESARARAARGRLRRARAAPIVRGASAPVVRVRAAHGNRRGHPHCRRDGRVQGLRLCAGGPAHAASRYDARGGQPGRLESPRRGGRRPQGRSVEALVDCTERDRGAVQSVGLAKRHRSCRIGPDRGHPLPRVPCRSRRRWTSGWPLAARVP